MAVRIALTKGRLEKQAVALLETAGFECGSARDKGRKLVLPADHGNLELVLAKAPDVITYVENGVCDMGIVGKDVILEHGHSFYEVLDLGFGACRFAVAAPKDTRLFQGYATRRIATKYPKVTRDYFARRGMDVDIVKIEGSVELAPILGLCDAIVDIVETGDTLRENGLEVMEDICRISARLIVNIASLKLNKNYYETFIHRLEQQLPNTDSKGSAWHDKIN